MTNIRRRRSGTQIPGEPGTAAMARPPVPRSLPSPGQPVTAAAEPPGTPHFDHPDAKPRRRRASVGGHALKLTAPARPGYTRRFFNDDGNRIAEAEELGYTPVSDTKAKTPGLGSQDSRLVGTKATGEPLRSILMETPDELYAEGVAEREAANRQIDEAITAGRDSTGRLENQYGHGSITTDS